MLERGLFLFILIAALFSPKGFAAGKADNLGMKDGFEIQLWAVVENEKFEGMELADIPPEDYAKQADLTKHVHGFFLMKNPALDDEHNSNVTARVLVRRPDGSIYKEIKRLPCWTARQPVPRNKMVGSIRTIDIALDEDDPKGTYVIEAWVTDNVTQNQIYVTYAINFQ